jgi:membrane protein
LGSFTADAASPDAGTVIKILFIFVHMKKLSTYFSNLRVVKRTVSKSKKLILPGFEGIPLYDVMAFFFKEIQKGQLNDRAGSISFFFLLALPPTCIFLFTLLPYIPLENLEFTLYTLVRDLTPNQNTYRIVRGVIYDFLHTQRTGLLSFSFLLAIFYSSTAVLGILRSFYKQHPSFRKRNFLQLRWIAIKLNCLLILLLITTVCLMVAERALLRGLLAPLHLDHPTLRFLIGAVRWVIIVLMFFTVISLIYTLGPSMNRRWKFVSAGSSMATFLMILTTVGFSYYVTHFSSYNRIYGSIGSILVLMVWIYINSFVLLIGFELNASINMIRQEAEARQEKELLSEEDIQGLS